MFEIDRTGEFVCAIDPSSPHCGKDNQPFKTFAYRVVCTATDDSLDDHQFLVDNMAISAFFEQNFGPASPINISCEAFAKQAAHSIFQLIPKRDCCVALRVSITPFAGATITYIWAHPKELEKANATALTHRRTGAKGRRNHQTAAAQLV